MDNKMIQKMQTHFDSLSHLLPDENIEFWFARELQEPLGYTKWERFRDTIARAITSCETTGYDPDNHFRGVTKMVKLGSGAERAIEDFMLTRYACYLIAQNGDPRKEPIAFAQSYFAIQTRKQELIEDRMRLQARLDARDRLRESEKTLSQNIYERGVDDRGFGRIRSAGDAALFGKPAAAMKEQLDVRPGRPLADFLPTLTIAAKNLATEMTNHNTEEKDLYGETSITSEHVSNNRAVRSMLADRGIHPEDLPPSEDIKNSSGVSAQKRRSWQKAAGSARIPRNRFH